MFEPLSPCLPPPIPASPQGRDVSIVLTQWGPTRGRPTELVGQLPPCCSPSLTTKLGQATSQHCINCVLTELGMTVTYFLIPFHKIGYKNQTGVEPEPLSLEKAVSLVQDVFSAATERDIYTGDRLRVSIITAAGVEVRDFPLRRD